MSSTSAVVSSAAGGAAGAKDTSAVLFGLVETVLSILLVTTPAGPRVPIQAKTMARSLWSRTRQGAGPALLTEVGWGVLSDHP